MTHDLSRLATAEQIMNGNNPFETVDTPLGTMERWRAEAMLIGTTSGILDVYRTIRADATAQTERADADKARTALIHDLCAKVDAAHTRLDNLVAELAAEREARRADEARQKKFDEEPIELPPDLHDYQAKEPPAKVGNDGSKEPEPNLELEDNVGDLPKEIEDPPDPVPEPKGQVYPQPIAVSLNEK
jgi:hypothetical protein